MRALLTWRSIVLASLSAFLVLLAADASPGLRLPVALWFLLACPGLAFIPLTGIGPRYAAFAVSVAASVGIDVVAALVLLYAQVGITPLTSAAAVGVPCLVGCVIQEARAASGSRRIAATIRGLTTPLVAGAAAGAALWGIDQTNQVTAGNFGGGFLAVLVALELITAAVLYGLLLLLFAPGNGAALRSRLRPGRGG